MDHQAPGKTTTLVHAIKEVVKTEKQVLVCSQSNAAVDLLVEKLEEQKVSVLRLGHPARLTHEVIENSLDVKISKHPFFKELKNIRIKEEEYKRMASQYKRSFGKEERFQRELLRKEARLYRDDAKKRIEKEITDDLMASAQVVACTLVGSSHRLVLDKTFKTVFIDEGSQALEPACWIAIKKAYRVIMAGDHLQLPPTVKSYEAKKRGLEKTLFEKAIALNGVSVMLNRQYRMHPQIMQFSSDHFYQGELETAEEVLLRERGTENDHFLFYRYRWLWLQ